MRINGANNYKQHLNVRKVIRELGIGESKYWTIITRDHLDTLKKLCSVYHVKNNRFVSTCFKSRPDIIRRAYEKIKAKIKSQNI